MQILKDGEVTKNVDQTIFCEITKAQLNVIRLETILVVTQFFRLAEIQKNIAYVKSVMIIELSQVMDAIYQK